MPALNQSYSVTQFYILKDNITGVLALGSFSAKNFTAFGISLLTGLQELKTAGAERLIVDVVGTLLKPIILQLITSLFTVEQQWTSLKMDLALRSRCIFVSEIIIAT
jgi:hypothetical protein